MEQQINQESSTQQLAPHFKNQTCTSPIHFISDQTSLPDCSTPLPDQPISDPSLIREENSISLQFQQPDFPYTLQPQQHEQASIQPLQAQQTVSVQQFHNQFGKVHNKLNELISVFNILQRQIGSSRIDCGTQISLLKSGKGKIKYKRRKAEQINKSFKCLVGKCSLGFGDKHSLIRHMLGKHGVCKRSLLFDKQGGATFNNNDYEHSPCCKCEEHSLSIKESILRRSQLHLLAPQ